MRKLTRALCLVLVAAMLFTGCTINVNLSSQEATSAPVPNIPVTAPAEPETGENAQEAKATEAATEAATEPASPSAKDVTVIYTNDVHTYLYNTETDEAGNVKKLLTYGSVAALRKELEQKGENVILVDAGDHVQGTAYGGWDSGETVIELMNACGYDVAAIGNHEIDYGQFQLFNLMELSDFPHISCNFCNASDNTPVFPPYHIVDRGGVKVAFVGITTPEMFTSTASSYFDDENGNMLYTLYGAMDGQDLYALFQKAIDEVTGKADYIIGLGHLGVDPSSRPWTSEEVIAHTHGLDAFIDGHSHTVMESKTVLDAEGKEILLTQTGAYFKTVGVMRLTQNGITAELVTDYADHEETEEAITDKLSQDVNAVLGEKIADSPINYTTVDLSTGERLIRRAETNLGDLTADAVYYYFNFEEELDCDAVVYNGGGIRTDIEVGDVNYLTCKALHPFGNVICMVRVTGRELLNALEYGAKFIGLQDESGAKAEFGGFLQVAGIKYCIDPNKECTLKFDEAGNYLGEPEGEYRVYGVEVYNRKAGCYEPLDLEKSYTVGGINYLLRNGGNGYEMFTDAALVKDYVGEDYLILSDYLLSFTTTDNGYACLATEYSPLTVYPGYLLDYENPAGSGRIVIDSAQ